MLQEVERSIMNYVKYNQKQTSYREACHMCAAIAKPACNISNLQMFKYLQGFLENSQKVYKISGFISKP